MDKQGRVNSLRSSAAKEKLIKAATTELISACREGGLAVVEDDKDDCQTPLRTKYLPMNH